MNSLLVTWLRRSVPTNDGTYPLIQFAFRQCVGENICEIETKENVSLDYKFSIINVQQEENIPLETLAFSNYDVTIDEETDKNTLRILKLDMKTAYSTIAKLLLKFVQNSPSNIVYGFGFDDFFPYFLSVFNKKYDKDIESLFSKYGKQFVDVKELSKTLYDYPEMGQHSISTVFLKSMLDNGYDTDKIRHTMKIMDMHKFEHSWGFCASNMSRLITILETMLRNKFNKNQENLVQYYNSPHLLNTIPFGKYKGMTFDELAKTDPQYIEFLLRNNGTNGHTSLDKNILFSLQHAVETILSDK